MSLSVKPDLLRAHRERAHLSREQVAVRLGRAFSTICAYETGTIPPSAAVLAALADAYGCGIQDFFSDADADQTVGA